uniref:BRX domain-containing protein n=1 Tax=Oryza brachyantha TaxID=4533 RepID=J3NC24_ORYBR
MHVCFHGGAVASGGGGGRIAKSIRDFTKILISRGSGSNARARRRQMRRCKDAAPAAMASASAKIAPAQLQEEEEAAQGGGREQGFCDKCCSSLMEAGGAEEEAAANMTEEGDREWVAEPEPGVLLTLAPRPDGTTNCLRRIRFREELFDAWAAQCCREMFGEVKARVWWEENKGRLHHLYSF